MKWSACRSRGDGVTHRPGLETRAAGRTVALPSRSGAARAAPVRAPHGLERRAGRVARARARSTRARGGCARSSVVAPSSKRSATSSPSRPAAAPRAAAPAPPTSATT